MQIADNDYNQAHSDIVFVDDHADIDFDQWS